MCCADTIDILVTKLTEIIIECVNISIPLVFMSVLFPFVNNRNNKKNKYIAVEVYVRCDIVVAVRRWYDDVNQKNKNYCCNNYCTCFYFFFAFSMRALTLFALFLVLDLSLFFFFFCRVELSWSRRLKRVYVSVFVLRIIFLFCRFALYTCGFDGMFLCEYLLPCCKYMNE